MTVAQKTTQKTTPQESILIAIDIGNSRVKFGQFSQHHACTDSAQGMLFKIASTMLPDPLATWSLTPPKGISCLTHAKEVHENLLTEAVAMLRLWLDETLGSSFNTLSIDWVIASVSAPGTCWVHALIAAVDLAASESIEVLTHEDLPIPITLEKPASVGLDRLVAGVAANRIRKPQNAVVVVDLGTAIKVDYLSNDGTFQGGALMPGLMMSANAMHNHTDKLPQLEYTDFLKQTPALGKSTKQAMQAGLFWGTVGAIRELVTHYTKEAENRLEIIVAGGDAKAILAELKTSTEQKITFTQHLTLSGIAISVAYMRRNAEQKNSTNRQLPF